MPKICNIFIQKLENILLSANNYKLFEGLCVTLRDLGKNIMFNIIIYLAHQNLGWMTIAIASLFYVKYLIVLFEPP